MTEGMTTISRRESIMPFVSIAISPAPSSFTVKGVEIGASSVPIISRVSDNAPFPSYMPDQTHAATAVGIEYSRTKPRIIEGLSEKKA